MAAKVAVPRASARQYRSHLSRLAAGLLAGAVALAGTVTFAAAQDNKPEQSEVTVFAEPSFNTPVQLITAKNKGFFDKFGLKVDVRYFQSASEVPAGMVGGSIVLAHGGLANPLITADQGHKVKIVAQIADWSRSTSLVVQPELANATPQDLVGKILVGPDIPVLKMFWLNWSKLNGIDPASVKWQNTAPSDAYAAFLSKQADAMLLWPPFTRKAVDEAGAVLWQDGQRSHRPGAEGDARVYYNWGVVFVSDEWYQQNPRTVEAYLSGLYLAQAYMKCHAKEVAEIVSKEVRVEPANGEKEMALNTYSLDMDSSFVTATQGAVDFYSGVGMLKNKYDMSQIIDPSVIDKIKSTVEIPAEWQTCS